MKIFRMGVIATAVLSLLYLQLSGIDVHARYAPSSAGNPLVVIARDVTAVAHCERTDAINLGTPQQSIVRSRCQAGDIVETFVVQLSQARSQRTAYVLLPSPDASKSSQLQTDQKIRDLMAATRRAARATVQGAVRQQVSPLLACGGSGTAGLMWNPSFNATQLTAFIHYYKTQDCKQLYFEQTGIQQSEGSSNDYWDSDVYDSANLSTTYGVWNLYCRGIPHSSTSFTTYTIDHLEPVGGDFFMAVRDAQLFGGCSGDWDAGDFGILS
ncbi:MAG: hypothetical protein ACHQ4H_06495 [Ktedonobacterales bacterium]